MKSSPRNGVELRTGARQRREWRAGLMLREPVLPDPTSIPLPRFCAETGNPPSQPTGTGFQLSWPRILGDNGNQYLVLPLHRVKPARASIHALPSRPKTKSQPSAGVRGLESQNGNFRNT